jgi:hypothetical protein
MQPEFWTSRKWVSASRGGTSTFTTWYRALSAVVEGALRTTVFPGAAGEEAFLPEPSSAFSEGSSPLEPYSTSSSSVFTHSALFELSTARSMMTWGKVKSRSIRVVSRFERMFLHMPEM